MPGSISGAGVGWWATGCVCGLKGHHHPVPKACAGTLEPTSTVPKAAATNARRNHGRNGVRDIKLISLSEFADVSKTIRGGMLGRKTTSRRPAKARALDNTAV